MATAKMETNIDNLIRENLTRRMRAQTYGGTINRELIVLCHRFRVKYLQTQVYDKSLYGTGAPKLRPLSEAKDVKPRRGTPIGKVGGELGTDSKLSVMEGEGYYFNGNDGACFNLSDKAFLRRHMGEAITAISPKTGLVPGGKGELTLEAKTGKQTPTNQALRQRFDPRKNDSPGLGGTSTIFGYDKRTTWDTDAFRDTQQYAAGIYIHVMGVILGHSTS